MKTTKILLCLLLFFPFINNCKKVVDDNPVNQAPKSNAGPDLTIFLPATTVVLIGSGTDPEGAIASYGWSKISGPTQYAIDSPANARATVFGLVEGIYEFELKVTDKVALAGRDTVKVIVQPASNQAPTVAAGADITFYLVPGNHATLIGAVFDSDDPIDLIRWTQLSGPGNSVIGSPSTRTTTVTGLVAGVYEFELRATDARGLSASDTIKLNALIPPTTVVIAGQDSTIQLPFNMGRLHASVSPNLPFTPAWRRISGPGNARIEYPQERESRVFDLEEGVHLFEIAVTDQSGIVTRDTTKFTVLRDNNTYNNEVVLYVVWSCPFGCTASISNFGSIVPAGRTFLVYVRKSNGEWVICAPNSLSGWDFYNSFYFLNGNTMELYSDDVSDTGQPATVKILY